MLFRSSLRGEPVALGDGVTSRNEWIGGNGLPKVPVDVAATGPRVIGIGACLAERVTFAVGAEPERVAAAIATAAQTTGREVGVHIKVDTGMHRMGAQPSEVLGIAQYVASHPQLTVEGLYTHFAVADEPSHPANARQLDTFRSVLDTLSARGINPPIVHAANSAAALTNADSRFTMARIGIATYGLLPGRGVAEECKGLIPAMSLKARVSAVRWVDAGEAVSYGLRTPVTQQTLIATVPIGYADGVPRRLGSAGASVLINGSPRRIAGTVTMDQIMVDCGNDSAVSVGDEVVLIGRQGEHIVTADDWAGMTDTIGYEIVCGVSPRIFRRYA